MAISHVRAKKLHCNRTDTDRCHRNCPEVSKEIKNWIKKKISQCQPKIVRVVSNKLNKNQNEAIKPLRRDNIHEPRPELEPKPKLQSASTWVPPRTMRNHIYPNSSFVRVRWYAVTSVWFCNARKKLHRVQLGWLCFHMKNSMLSSTGGVHGHCFTIPDYGISFATSFINCCRKPEAPERVRQRESHSPWPSKSHVRSCMAFRRSRFTHSTDTEYKRPELDVIHSDRLYKDWGILYCGRKAMAFVCLLFLLFVQEVVFGWWGNLTAMADGWQWMTWKSCLLPCCYCWPCCFVVPCRPMFFTYNFN